MTNHGFLFDESSSKISHVEFGKLSDLSQLVDLDWTLPAEPPANLLLKSGPSGQTTFHIGAPAWSHKKWVGKIYPSKAKTSDYLYHYSRCFNAVELNTSHYRIPSLEQTQRWREQVPEKFQFCSKVFQGISHSRNGLLDKKLLAEWLRFLENLGTNRGPSFIQLPPYFSYLEKAQLFHFLQQWPTDLALAIEFRHPSWWNENRVILPALQEYLVSKNIGLVITDVAGRRDVLHTSLSAGFSMIRFIGNNLHSSDFDRAKLWINKIKSWNERGLEDLYLFVHQPDDVLVPEMATSLITALNQALGRHALSPFPKHLGATTDSSLKLF